MTTTLQDKKLDLMEEAVALSSYHFDFNKHDPKFDQAIELGSFECNWQDEIETLIASAKTRSFGTRNLVGEQVMADLDNPTGNKDEYTDMIKSYRPFEQEFFDKTDLDYYNYPIIDKTNEIGPKVKAIFEAFQLAPPSTYTVHIQKVGQVFPYHIDFFHRRRWEKAEQDKVIRIVVHLNDWVPGQCMGYGNGIHTHWKAGDFHTFSHADVPHWTSNANYTPRLSLLITGVKTAATEELLQRAKTETIKI